MTDEQKPTRKLRAILSADVKGYSLLMADDEAYTLRKLKECRSIMAMQIEQHNGRVIDSPGDNILADFASAVDAVMCAVEIQKVLKEKNEALPTDKQLEFRIGVNVGDVIQDIDRIYGHGVNVAARIEGLSEPGGVSISRNAFDHIKEKLSFGYEYLGDHEVKNIKDPVRVYKVLMGPEDAGKLIGDEPKAAIAKWIWPTIVVAAIVITSVVWQVYQNISKPDFKPASIDKMAFALPERPSIAVLPFDNMSGDPKQDYFCEGLSEQIITNLSKVSGLFVIARNSSFSFKDKVVKVQQVAEELGVRYVLEGSLQKSGDTVRITAQLVDAITGYHLWAETYEREIQDAFTLQDEITIKILGSVGAELTKGERERIYAKGTDSLEAYLNVSKGFEHFERQGKEENILARKFAKKAIELDPNYPSAWNLLGGTYLMDRWVGSTDTADPWDESIKAYKKALELDEAYAPSHGGLAMIYGFQKKYEKALAQVQKGIALNPGFPIMHLGYVLVWVGRYEEAVHYFQKAIRHDPKAPTFYYNGLGHAYRGLEQYEDAITAYKKALEREPDYLIGHIFLTSAYYLGGREAEARAEVAEVLRLQPKYSVARLAKVLPYQDKKFYHRTLESIRKAGLPEYPPTPKPDKPSIAVLPFTNISDDPRQEYFSDGISEDLITDLSKISGLLVISRNSTFAYKDKSLKVQQIAEELGAAYVLEGSVRKVANKVRINAQLIDGNSGHHIWADRFDDTYRDIFTLQDKITRKIVTALSLKLTIDEEEKITLRYTDNVEAYDAYLRGREQIRLGSAKGLATAVQLLERAIELDPDYSAAHAGLANVYRTAIDRNFYKELNWQDARSRFKKHLQLAMKNPTPYVLYNVAKTRLYQRRWDEAIAEAERTIALEPNYSGGYLMMGLVLTFSGRSAEAIDYLKKAMRLNPHNPASCLYALGLSYYFQKRYEEAASALEKSRKLGYGGGPWPLAISYAQMGRGQEAAEILANYFDKRGWKTVCIENTFKYWPFKEQKDLDHWAAGLRKSGLIRPWNPVYRRDYTTAIAEAKKALKLKPDDAHALYTMGESLLYSGRSAEAIDYIKRAMSLGTEYPRYYMYTLGVAQFCSEKYEEAAISFEEAILKRKYHNRAPKWLLAATYAHLGRQEDAENVLNKYMQERKYKGFTAERVLKYYLHSFYNPKDTERFARGLHKAGLPMN